MIASTTSDISKSRNSSRNWSICRIAAMVALFAVFLIPSVLMSAVFGQNPPVKATSFRDRVVDKVTLNDGITLWGAVVSRKPVRLFISMTWLRLAQPDLLADEILPELKKNKSTAPTAIAASLQTEIDRLQPTTPEDRQRIGLLKEIHGRLVPDEPSEPFFIILELSMNRVRNLETQPGARRELCRLAILNNIPDVEDSHWKSIAEQLQRIPPNKRRTAAPVAQQDDEMSRQRILAAVDVRLNAATRVIRNGVNVVDETATPDLAMIIDSMLGGNVENLLSELLNEGVSRQQTPTIDKLPDAAAKIANSRNHSTVVLSGFDFNIDAGSASVTRQLFRKLDDGQWKLLISTIGTSTIANLKPGQVEGIENDPQVKEISQLVKGLGLGGKFDTALQLGAVVQNAMRDAELAFEEKIQGTITTKNLMQSQETPIIMLPENPARKTAP